MKRNTRLQLENKIRRSIKNLQKKRKNVESKGARAKINYALAELMFLLI